MADDPYGDPPAAPEQEEAPVGDNGGPVFRTVHPVAEFTVPDHSITITRYGTQVPADKVEAIRQAAVASGVSLVEVK